MAFGAFALAGALLVLSATELGVGVSSDSTAYINAARGWLLRFGFPQAPGTTSHWIPPGYAALLAAGSYLTFGADPFVVVYLSGFDERWFLPSEQELVTRASAGTIYRRAP